DGAPLAGYVLDLWQADKDGNYAPDFRLRGKIVTDAMGRYRFQTIVPGRYADDEGIRPAHIHVTFRTPDGEALLTTQVYFEGDAYLGEADYATVKGTCNAADPDRYLVLQSAIVGAKIGKRATFDAILPRA